MREPTLIDCFDCYKQYRRNKSFNYDCPYYEPLVKCPWIDVIAKELGIYIENGCNEGLIKKLENGINTKNKR